jgi:hypothetical protein
MVVIRPNTEKQGRSHFPETQKVNPDGVAFADVMGNETKQTQIIEVKQTQMGMGLLEAENENVPDLSVKSDMKETLSQTEDPIRNDMMPMIGQGLAYKPDADGTGMMPDKGAGGDLAVDALPKAEHLKAALDAALVPKTGKETGYSQTWQMNNASPAEGFEKAALRAQLSGSADPKLANAQEGQEDQVSRLMRELGGQLDPKKETLNRPEIALTEKFAMKDPALNEVTSQNRSNEGLMSMMMDKNLGITSHNVVNTPSLSPTPFVAPQVVHMIRQEAMSMQPYEVKEMTIRLNPKELGKLDLFMRMENGQLFVSIKAAEMGTGQLLQSQMQDLKQNLRDAGIDANVEMDFGDQAQEQQQSFEEALREGRGGFGSDRDDQLAEEFVEELPDESHLTDDSVDVQV